MERRVKRKQLQNERRKRQVVQNWLSSFVVTTVVVVAAVSFGSDIPKDSNLTLTRVGTNIYYEAFVEYEETQITEEITEEYPEEHYFEEENKLTIVAKSSLDEETQELYYGQNSGSFLNLLPNTNYTISIYYQGKFSPVLLEKENITTSNTYEGQILSAQLFEDAFLEQVYCNIQTAYSSPNEELSNITLNATYYVEGEYSYQQEFGPIEVTENNFYYTLYYLPYANGSMEITLSATLNQQESVILDQKTILMTTIVN